MKFFTVKVFKKHRNSYTGKGLISPKKTYEISRLAKIFPVAKSPKEPLSPKLRGLSWISLQIPESAS
jgi:hypothetical protein